MIHPSVRIGKHCVISDNVDIGENVVIGNYVEINDKTVIGNDCYIGSYSIIEGAHLFGKVYLQGRNRIGANTIIQQNVMIKYNAILTSNLIVGANVFIGVGAVTLGSDIDGAQISGMEIGDGVYIGGQSIIAPGLKIPAGTIIGANSYLRKCIFKGTYVGSPARKIK